LSFNTVETYIYGYPDEPGCERTIQVKPVEKPVGANKSLLSCVFRVTNATKHMVGSIEHGLLMPVHDFTEGIPIALQDSTSKAALICGRHL
jgi:hypothetical protein